MRTDVEQQRKQNHYCINGKHEMENFEANAGQNDISECESSVNSTSHPEESIVKTKQQATGKKNIYCHQDGNINQFELSYETRSSWYLFCCKQKQSLPSKIPNLMARQNLKLAIGGPLYPKGSENI